MKVPASERKYGCGPYHLRLACCGLHTWLELSIPYCTFTLTLLRR